MLGKVLFRRSRELKFQEKLLKEDGFSIGTSESDAKLDECTLEEVETSLREALTLNNEEARALLGRIEYQRDNWEAALQLFDGIDSFTVIPRVKFLIPNKRRPRRRRPYTDVSQSITLPAAGVLIEALHLKAKSLEKMGRLREAGQECKSLLDTFASEFPHGVPDNLKDTKVQDILNKSLELLPELLRKEGRDSEAIAAYRRAVLTHWNLGTDCLHRIQKNLALLLLYSGEESGSFQSISQRFGGSFIPSNNTEEAILLLLILLKKSMLGKCLWDPTVMEHLCFALSICGRWDVLGEQYEIVMPGFYSRSDRWYSLALCYCGAKKDEDALRLLRKVLNGVEKPNDVSSLLLAADICIATAEKDDGGRALEALNYTERALAVVTGSSNRLQIVEQVDNRYSYLTGRAYQKKGNALRKQMKMVVSDTEKENLAKECLGNLEKAANIEKNDAEVVFEVGVEYGEQGNLNGALVYAKRFHELTCGASSKGWRLVALILSAQQRYREAEIVIDGAIAEMSENVDQLMVLRTKAKLQLGQGKMHDAVSTYKLLLQKIEDDDDDGGGIDDGEGDGGIDEGDGDGGGDLAMEVWHEMASVYVRLCKWDDAERCLASSSSRVSSATWHGYGCMYEAQGRMEEAMEAYTNAVTVYGDGDGHGHGHGESKVRMGVMLLKKKRLVGMAKSLLVEAIHENPKNYEAWYYLGMVNEEEMRLSEAADCYQAAYLLYQSSPVETFANLRK